jgi:glycosyltransferase involved in cell wall biosynthesis
MSGVRAPVVEGRALRVGMLAPISWRTPPRHYGPWERVTSLVTEGLVARGVDVTLFATADSLTAARLVGTAPRGYSEDPDVDAKVWEGLHIATFFERAHEFDIVHNQFDFLPLTYSRLVDTPLVTTIHGFSSPRIVPVYERYDDRVTYVAISDADRHPALTYAATVHHGIEMDAFPLSTEPAGHLLFFGRIHPDKGVATAIAVAARAGLPLLIAGIVADQAYFDGEIAPHVDGERVRWIGSVGPDRRAQVLGDAVALLHLIDFEEPFGLSVVESMACGTPVIAHARGSMPEIVRDGENGFLVTGLDDAVDAIGKAAVLDRAGVRGSVEHRFSAERMVDGYLDVYRGMLAGRVRR